MKFGKRKEGKEKKHEEGQVNSPFQGIRIKSNQFKVNFIFFYNKFLLLHGELLNLHQKLI